MNETLEKNVPQQDAVEGKREFPQEASPEQSAEALQNEIASETVKKNEEIAALEQMMADMGADLEPDARNFMQEQIDQLKAELASVHAKETAEVIEQPIDLRRIGEVQKMEAGSYKWNDKNRSVTREIVTVNGQKYELSQRAEYEGVFEASREHSHVQLPDGQIALKGYVTSDAKGERERFTQSFDALGRIASTECIVHRDPEKGDYTITESYAYDDDGNVMSIDATIKEKDSDGSEIISTRKTAMSPGGMYQTRSGRSPSSFFQVPPDSMATLLREQKINGSLPRSIIHGRGQKSTSASLVAM